jgi:hypothetical protein
VLFMAFNKFIYYIIRSGLSIIIEIMRKTAACSIVKYTALLICEYIAELCRQIAMKTLPCMFNGGPVFQWLKPATDIHLHLVHRNISGSLPFTPLYIS